MPCSWNWSASESYLDFWRAREDLRANRVWLDERDQVAAGRVIREIRETVSLLQSQSMLGRVGQVTGTRELVIQHYPYLVIYEAVSGVVRVLSVFHTSRAWWLYPRGAGGVG